MLQILMFHTTLTDEIARIENQYGVKIHLSSPDNLPGSEILNQIEAVAGYLPADIGEKLPNLRWMHLFSAGVERSVDYAAARGLLLTNGRGAYGIVIAEHSLALMLALSRRLDFAVSNMPSGNWDRSAGTGAREIRGSTVGIVGLGDIGGRLAYLCHALGATVLAYKRTPGQAAPYIERLYTGDKGLDDMLAECDYVAVCLPGTPKTRHLFDEARLTKIKPGAILTNIGRGTIIDTDALVRLLKSGHIAGAGLDVTDPEPLPAGHELWRLPNVIITPHVAGSSNNIPGRVIGVFEENLAAYLRGVDPPNRVNYIEGY